MGNTSSYRKRVSEGGHIISKHGDHFMNSTDIADYSRAKMLYNAGIGIIAGSIGISFYISREMTKNTANTGKYFKYNMG